jgi:hypothetical protein
MNTFHDEFDISSPLYGESYSIPSGFIGSSHPGTHNHRFGGNSWKVLSVDSNAIPSCILVFTLDLGDPALKSIKVCTLQEIPFVAPFDTSISVNYFQISQLERTVSCIHEGRKLTSHPNNPTGLQIYERRFSFMNMTDADFPVSERHYWNACDHFLGGTRFLRILGPPLWAYAVQQVTCQCGRSMPYLCSLGYECRSTPHSFMDSTPFFIGEIAFYWFFCATCEIIAVSAQPT